MVWLHRSTKFFTHGQSLVELVLAVGLSMLVVPAIFVGVFSAREGRVQLRERTQATALLSEATEAIKSIRDQGWSAVSTDGTYHPVVSSGRWTLAAGSEVTNGFTRSIVISSVYRDSSGAVVTSGGTLDPSTKRVTATVSWTQPYASSVSSVVYLTRYADNAVYGQTTQTEFNTGTHTGVVTTNTSGGEVRLGAGGQGNWCDPNLSITALDLPKNGVANAISAIPFRVVAGTGENASGVAFANVTITDTDPPSSSITGTFDGYKTNGVFVSGTYAYLATDDNTKEVVILDLNQLNPSTGKYTEVGYFNAPGSTNSNSVAVSGNVGLVTVGSTLYSFDLTSKTGSRPQQASRSLPGTGTKIVIQGSDAYISIADAAREMQIVRFNSTGTTLTNYGYADVNGAAAYDVTVNATGTRAYLATGADASRPEFFIVNTLGKSSSNPNLPSLGTYNASGMDPKGVAVVTGSKAILVGHGAEEYQVIDISTESSPVRCGGLQIDTGINGIASVLEPDNDAYSYLITGDSATELKIIEGGPGGQYADSGTFESATFDAGYQAAFNRIEFTATEPDQTDVKVQIAIADAVSGSCGGANFQFVGPDGTSSSYFESTAAVPFHDDGSGFENPGRCIRYKVFLSTEDSFATPVFESITINYSP